MRFSIKRATDLNGRRQPCEGAVRSDSGWEIEVNSLEQLLTLARIKQDGIVVSVQGDQPEITIYDGYLE